MKPLAGSSIVSKLEPEESATLREQGYTFVSLCGQEKNFVRCQDTPIVFKTLTQENEACRRILPLSFLESRLKICLPGQLTYAGSLKMPFAPKSLRVDHRGYLYHPSPILQRRARKADNVNPYGDYSLLKSELVLSQLSHSLTIDEASQSGSFEWLGREYGIDRLREEEVLRGHGYPDGQADP